MSTAEKTTAILVVGPAWVGDMVMAQVLFKLLRLQHPHTAIDVLAPAWSLPLLARMPEVRRAIAMPLGHGSLELGVRYRLGRELRAERYAQAILLPNSLKSAFVPFFARIPLRTGWRGEFRYGLLNDLRILDKQRYPLMIERFAALALPKQAALPSALPYPALRIDSERQQQLLHSYGLDGPEPLLALCPGAEFGPAKRWPEQHYASVAAALLAQGGRGAAELAGRLVAFQCERFGTPDATIGDAGAVCAVIARDGLRTERLPVRVELAGTWSRGRTIVDRRDWSGDLAHDPHGQAPTRVDVALEVDAARYAQLWLATVGGRAVAP